MSLEEQNHRLIIAEQGICVGKQPGCPASRFYANMVALQAEGAAA